MIPLRYITAILLCLAVAVCATPAAADDKNGVAPNTISLPSGPGTLEGLGGSFQPFLNTGTAGYEMAIAVPPGVNELLVCGMMTQNCVTHTAISKAAEKYDVFILVDCCTTVDEMIHNIALHALSTRVKLLPSSEAL